MRGDSAETCELLARVNHGDHGAFDRLLELHRTYLRKLVDVRMDDELRTRVDPSDVVQEAQLAATQKLERFMRDRPASFRIWLRGIALERLIGQRRKHLALKRSVRHEHHFSDASSIALAHHMMQGRPSQLLQRKELAQQIHEVIQQLKEADREILLLRHVEELSNVEAAEVLNLAPEAARKRLGRAMIRLTQLIAEKGIQI